ncbi:MAG: LLM class flavin-dependent oxidoreductase [Rhodospirillaceae bacterium]|nr:LLM class flavin-dependent oxidoreductase [Rhodospirillaceae bacterium]
MPTEYGLLLPHFGSAASKDKIIRGSQRAEALGFNSVFVRDHLVFHPHGMEGTDNTFIDPFVTLSAVSAVTSKIKLGFGSLIPHRHPLLLALMINSLEYMAGQRLLLSLGIGNFQVEFDAVGMKDWPRDEVAAEQVEILRKSWTHDHFSHQGKYYANAELGLRPRVAKPLPIWYAGATPASVRRALAFCDGWLPGRITLNTYKKRVEKLRGDAAAMGKPRLFEGCIPITSIDVDRESALRKVNVEGLLSNANQQKFWVKPDSGSFAKWEDLEGSFMVGTPDDIVKDVEKYLEVGIDHIVFDLRFRFDEWDQCVDLLGKEVLPRLRKLG